MMITSEIKKIAIIAGNGHLPIQAILACQQHHLPFHVLAIKHHCDILALQSHLQQEDNITPIKLTEIAKAFRLLNQFQISHILFIGGIRRPNMFEILPLIRDLQTLKFLYKYMRRPMGDDGILGKLSSLFTEKGYQIIALHDIAPHLLLTKSGTLGKVAPSQQDLADIQQGFHITQMLGTLDIGQAAIIQQGLVLGVEGIEGTDELIKRCHAYHRKGRGGILIKTGSYKQEKRIDIPTIGIKTIELAAQCGLSGIALECHHIMIDDAESVIKQANQHKLFLYSF